MSQVERATSNTGKQYLTKVVNVFNFNNVALPTFTGMQDFGLWTSYGYIGDGGEIRLIKCELPVYIPKNFEILEAKLIIQTLSTYLEGYEADEELYPYPDGYYGYNKLKLEKSKELSLPNSQIYRYTIYGTSFTAIVGSGLEAEQITGFGEKTITINNKINTIEYDLKNDIVAGEHCLFKLYTTDEMDFTKNVFFSSDAPVARMILNVYATEI